MILLAAVSTASAYMSGVITSLVLILISGLIAKSISFKPNLTDVSKRKLWFWVLAILCPIITFGITFAIYSGIKGKSAQNTYMVAMCIATVISFILYVVLGFIAAKTNKNGKLSNWF